ncbi:MAG: tripartite tricarboxylate transporter substrate binding protein [Deltaproteobacteria bacterium]|nr:tripartite tricarboxylate transporter substrate binding protein [Deltaproteobacteria bacterium]
MKKVSLGLILLCLLFFVSVNLTLAQNYPDKAIQLVVPWTPGGSNDVLARLIGQKLLEKWKQPVVVENRPGAAGNIGATLVAKAAPDGYTLLVAAQNILAINPTLYSNSPFDTFKDFTPIATMGAVPVLLTVNPSVPAHSVKELVAIAKSKSEGLTYGSSGIGSPQHLTAELFMKMAGVKMVHVAYKGAAQTIPDLISGQIQVLCCPINSILPHVKSGKVRALAVAGVKRVPSLPDLPTVTEAGVKNVLSDIWISIVGPKGMAPGTVNKINSEVAKILASDDVVKNLRMQGIEPLIHTPADFAKLIRSDYDRWSKLIKELGIRAEQ